MRHRTCFHRSLIAAGIGLSVMPVSAAFAQGAPVCDASLATAFSHDPDVTLVQVKRFEQGERLALSGDKAPQALKARHPVCMVKLLFGPGNPGPG